MSIDMMQMVNNARFNINIQTGMVNSITLSDASAGFMIRANVDTSSYNVEVAKNSPTKVPLNNMIKSMFLMMAISYENGYRRAAL